MEEKEWLCFEKSGKVSDYLAYCQSSAGRYSEYEAAVTGRCEKQDGADVYSDGNGIEDSSGGGI